MQTSLFPSVCRGFLGCQIEKGVNEVNLTKKIISCQLRTARGGGPPLIFGAASNADGRIPSDAVPASPALKVVDLVVTFVSKIGSLSLTLDPRQS